MVSLNGNTRQTGGGMTFFSDSLNSCPDDDPLLDAGMPALPQEEAVSRWMAQEIKKFRLIRTVKAIILAMVLYACLVVSVFLLPKYCRHKSCGKQDVTALVLYVHGGMWFLLLLIHMFLMHEHRNSLLHGYFTFHLDTRLLKRLPLLINSGANAVLVVVSKILGSVCHQDDSCAVLTKANYLQILISLEAAIALVTLLVYLAKTLHFNKAQNTPDFLRVSTSAETVRTQRQVGFRAPFDMETWAMKQCWNDIYQLRRGCAALVEEKENLKQRLQHYQNVSCASIN